MKALFVILVSTLIGVSAFFGIKNAQRETLSEMQLDNIEALSDNESDQVVKCYCRTDERGICSAAGKGAYCGGDPCDSHDSNCR